MINVGAFSVIVQPVVEPMDRFTALIITITELRNHIQSHRSTRYLFNKHPIHMQERFKVKENKQNFWVLFPSKQKILLYSTMQTNYWKRKPQKELTATLNLNILYYFLSTKLMAAQCSSIFCVLRNIESFSWEIRLLKV